MLRLNEFISASIDYITKIATFMSLFLFSLTQKDFIVSLELRYNQPVVLLTQLGIPESYQRQSSAISI